MFIKRFLIHNELGLDIFNEQLVGHLISAAVWVGEICLRCDGLAGPCMVCFGAAWCFCMCLLCCMYNRLPLKTITAIEEECNKPLIDSSHNTFHITLEIVVIVLDCISLI